MIGGAWAELAIGSGATACRGCSSHPRSLIVRFITIATTAGRKTCYRNAMITPLPCVCVCAYDALPPTGRAGSTRLASDAALHATLNPARLPARHMDLRPARSRHDGPCRAKQWTDLCSDPTARHVVMARRPGLRQPPPSLSRPRTCTRLGSATNFGLGCSSLLNPAVPA